MHCAERSACTQVSGALWILSENHHDNKTAITEAGAISAIVSQLSPASERASALSERAHANAANALASLAYASTANQAQITPLLVALLEPSAAMEVWLRLSCRARGVTACHGLQVACQGLQVACHQVRTATDGRR